MGARRVLPASKAPARCAGFRPAAAGAGAGCGSLARARCRRLIPASTLADRAPAALPPPPRAEYLRGWRVKTSPVPVKPRFFAGLKSTNYLPNVLALMDAEAEGFHQVRLLWGRWAWVPALVCQVVVRRRVVGRGLPPGAGGCVCWRVLACAGVRWLCACDSP